MYPRKSSSQIKPQKLATSLLGIIGIIALISIGTLWHQRRPTLEQSTLDKLNRLKTKAERAARSGGTVNLTNSERTLETYSLPTGDTLTDEGEQGSAAVDAPIPLEAPSLSPRRASNNYKFDRFSDSSPSPNR